MSNYDIYYKISDQHREEDIRAMMDQMIEDGDIPKDAVAPTAEALDRALGFNDTYWDAYWATVRYIIEDINGR